MKSWTKSIVLIGFGFLLGSIWFRLGPSFKPAFEQETGLASSAQSLPRALPGFEGRIGRTYEDSQPHFPAKPKAPPTSC